jgi:hypothetical protein
MLSDLESPDYESIIKQQLNILMLLLLLGSSPSLTKFIESSGKPFLPFVPKMNSRKRIPILSRKGSIKLILLANMYNNFFKKILVVACVVFLYSCDKDYIQLRWSNRDNHFDFVKYIKRRCYNQKIADSVQ